MPFDEAFSLISHLDDIDAVTRHIVGQIIKNPDAETRWREIAAACEELFEATFH